jgi:hypothetical protein
MQKGTKSMLKELPEMKMCAYRRRGKNYTFQGGEGWV